MAGRLPSYGLGTCGRCGALIRWALTAAGKRQPLDAQPSELGNIGARLDHLQVWRARVVAGDERLGPLEYRFMPHAATCAPPPSPARQLPLIAPEQMPNVLKFDPARRRRRRTPEH